MIEIMFSEAVWSIAAVPPSVLAGVGLLLLFFGLYLVTVEIVLFGVFVGLQPGVSLFLGNEVAMRLGRELVLPYGKVLLMLIIGAFSGGFIALSARGALKFVIVGLTWITLLGWIWPGAFNTVAGNVLALTGFFIAGFFANELYIIATSVLGSMLVMIALHRILALNYPSAFRGLTGHPATMFVLGGILAFLGTIIQTRSLSPKSKKEQKPDIENEALEIEPA